MIAFDGLHRNRIYPWLFTVGLLLLPAVLLGGWALSLWISGNVHEVEPGQLYRSAQLSGRRLNEVINHYGIRTVINLRGRNPNQDWYRDEMAVIAQGRTFHIDVDMSATKEPSSATIGRLIRAFNTAPRPILVHCESGADRSGLASAIYEFRIAHRSAFQADKQLSIYYGHFPWLMSRTDAMDRAFERFAASDH